MASIKLINDTQENIRIAIFKKPYKAPSLKVIAWKIMTLSKMGGTAECNIPDNYQVHVRYSLDTAVAEDPNSGIKTGLLSIDAPEAKFMAKEGKDSGSDVRYVILETVFDDLPENLVHIENQASFGVWGHVLLDGQDVYPPQLITQGKTGIEDIASSFFAAVIDESVISGYVVKEEVLLSEPVEVEAGNTITVKGSKSEGYVLKVS